MKKVYAKTKNKIQMLWDAVAELNGNLEKTNEQITSLQLSSDNAWRELNKPKDVVQRVSKVTGNYILADLEIEPGSGVTNFWLTVNHGLNILSAPLVINHIIDSISTLGGHANTDMTVTSAFVIPVDNNTVKFFIMTSPIEIGDVIALSGNYIIIG